MNLAQIIILALYDTFKEMVLIAFSFYKVVTGLMALPIYIVSQPYPPTKWLVVAGIVAGIIAVTLTGSIPIYLALLSVGVVGGIIYWLLEQGESPLSEVTLHTQ
jgi:hypothetical protein